MTIIYILFSKSHDNASLFSNYASLVNHPGFNEIEITSMSCFEKNFLEFDKFINNAATSLLIQCIAENECMEKENQRNRNMMTH